MRQRLPWLWTLLAAGWLAQADASAALAQDSGLAQDAGGQAAAAPAGAAGAEPASSEAIGVGNLLKVFQDGGPLMYPIALCSVIMLAVIVERLVMLRRQRVVPRSFVRRFVAQLRDGKLERTGALELCKKHSSAVAGVIAHAVAKWGRPSVEIEQALIDGGERAVTQLRRNVRTLNAVATIAPLLGLLGTVQGIILSFNEISRHQGLGRPEQLAEGIGIALLTTAFGLAVAIPALTAYWYFVSRVDRLVQAIDAAGREVVELISAESLEESRRRRARPSPPTEAVEPAGMELAGKGGRVKAASKAGE